MRLSCLLILTGLLLLPGCTFRSLRFYPEDLARIQQGESTRADIRAMFGKPAMVFEGEGGRTIDRYNSSFVSPQPDSHSPRNPNRVQLTCLEILYDSNDRVMRHLYYETATPVKRLTRKGFYAGEVIPEKEGEMVLSHARTEPELIRVFGPPMVKELDFEGHTILAWVYFKKDDKGELQDIYALIVTVNRFGTVLGHLFIRSLEEMKRWENEELQKEQIVWREERTPARLADGVQPARVGSV
jgi:hypothetical protein